MLDDHTFGVADAEFEGRFTRWRRHYRPAWMAALWFWVFFLLLALVTLFTGWASLPVTLSLQALMALAAGALAAVLLHREGHEQLVFAHMGAWAGILLVLTTLGVVLLVALWVGISTFGTTLPLMIPYCFSLPMAVVLCGSLGALGGRIVQAILKARETH